MSHTVKNLMEVKDSAPDFKLDHAQAARFATKDLDAEQTGVAHLRVKPGMRQPFAHRHDAAEEVYVVIAGSGQIKVDDEVVDLQRLDAVRLGPGTTHQVQAGPDGIEYLAFGPQYENDGELVHEGFWD